MSRIAQLCTVVLTAAPDPEVIYSPLFELCGLNIWSGEVTVKYIYERSKLRYIEFLDMYRQRSYTTQGIWH
jgi:hypothetical protein